MALFLNNEIDEVWRSGWRWRRRGWTKKAGIWVYWLCNNSCFNVENGVVELCHTQASWFWQHQTVQRFVVTVRIASWFVKSLHDFDSIRLCRNQLIFQNHLTSSSYKNSSFFPKLFTTQSYNQKQKFIKLISTQQHQHFTLIYQESQFTMNDSFSSKLLKQQLHKMGHPWHKSTTTFHNNNNIIKPWIHHNSTTEYHNSSIWA